MIMETWEVVKNGQYEKEFKRNMGKLTLFKQCGAILETADHNSWRNPLASSIALPHLPAHFSPPVLELSRSATPFRRPALYTLSATLASMHFHTTDTLLYSHWVDGYTISGSFSFSFYFIFLFSVLTDIFFQYRWIAGVFFKYRWIAGASCTHDEYLPPMYGSIIFILAKF
jgi:hypothetical protein